MITDSEKQEILSRILRSPEFSESKRLQELLRYLVQASIEGRSPKEITIAIEFFGKDPGFDPKEDPTVRVQINNLRKKLEHYYLTTVDPCLFRLEIPKGHYIVEFVPVTPSKEARAASRKPIVALLIVVILLAATVAYLVLTRVTEGFPTPASFAQNPMWSEFFQTTSRPTLVVLGDYLFLFDKSFVEKPGMIVRNPRINSLEDLRAATSHDPAFAKRYVQSEFTFLRPSASWGMAELIPILKGTPHPVSLKLASQLTPDDLKEFNVVYIGSFKTLHKLNRILHHFDLRYELTPAAVTVNVPKPDSSPTFYPQDVRGGEYEKDYAVIAKGAGPDGNTVLLILGFGDAAVLQAAKCATDPSFIPNAEEEYGKEVTTTPLYGVFVIETEGINQTGFKSTLRYFKKIRAVEAEVAF